jgi:putative ABC transport system ATP-binding protein
MMDKGRIVLDVEDEERKDMTIDDLLDKFAKVSGHQLTNDRILLAQ